MNDLDVKLLKEQNEDLHRTLSYVLEGWHADGVSDKHRDTYEGACRHLKGDFTEIFVGAPPSNLEYFYSLCNLVGYELGDVDEPLTTFSDFAQLLRYTEIALERAELRGLRAATNAVSTCAEAYARKSKGKKVAAAFHILEEIAKLKVQTTSEPGG